MVSDLCLYCGWSDLSGTLCTRCPWSSYTSKGSTDSLGNLHVNLLTAFGQVTASPCRGASLIEVIYGERI